MVTSLTRYAWFSIAAAILTIGIKTVAWKMTGSVSLLSDALESIVNLAAATITLAMLTVAAKPADEGHAFGHEKAEYFASGAEGAFIVLAAIAIGYTAIERFAHPLAIQEAWSGLAVSSVASLINLAVALVLLRAAKRHNSIALEADAHHLMTDVWTSVGVLLGVGFVALTGFARLDPIIALTVAANIVWTGVSILRRSAQGLLDSVIPQSEQNAVSSVLAKFPPPIAFHALRTRQSGRRRFITVHVLVPGEWTVSRGHALLEEVEREIRHAVPNANVFTHLEALEDPSSFEDIELERSSFAKNTAPTP
jgi:cation diffusion facilitator family transporter